MIIYLIRHGETQWNRSLKVQGKLDIPLNENGIMQAKIVASLFKNIKIDAIYSSNLSRAYVTAKIIASELKLNVNINSFLQEINMGRWEGSLWDDIKIEYKDFINRWQQDIENIPIPDGESYLEVQKRVYKAFCDIISKYNNDSKIIIVSHGIALKVLITKLIGISIQTVHKFSLDNASISSIIYENNFKINFLNNTFHLKGLGDIDTKKF
ncbi:MAG: histidine phosphatase family protein [Exilispira sp.]